MRLATLAFVVSALVAFGAFGSDSSRASDAGYDAPNNYASFYDLYAGSPSSPRDGEISYVICQDWPNNWNWDGWAGSWGWFNTFLEMEKWDSVLHGQGEGHHLDFFQYFNQCWSTGGLFDRWSFNVALGSVSDSSVWGCGPGSPTGCFLPFVRGEQSGSDYHTETGLPNRIQLTYANLIFNYSKARLLTQGDKSQLVLHEMGHGMAPNSEPFEPGEVGHGHRDCGAGYVMESIGCPGSHTSPTWLDIVVSMLNYHLAPH